MSSKSWYQSRLVWVNSIAAGVAVADQVMPMLPPTIAAKAATGVFVANIILRLLTSQPVGK